jgi:hypothetical protein
VVLASPLPEHAYSSRCGLREAVSLIYTHHTLYAHRRSRETIHSREAAFFSFLFLSVKKRSKKSCRSNWSYPHLLSAGSPKGECRRPGGERQGAGSCEPAGCRRRRASLRQPYTMRLILPYLRIPRNISPQKVNCTTCGTKGIEDQSTAAYRQATCCAAIPRRSPIRGAVGSSHPGTMGGWSAWRRQLLAELLVCLFPLRATSHAAAQIQPATPRLRSTPTPRSQIPIATWHTAHGHLAHGHLAHGTWAPGDMGK